MVAEKNSSGVDYQKKAVKVHPSDSVNTIQSNRRIWIMIAIAIFFLGLSVLSAFYEKAIVYRIYWAVGFLIAITLIYVEINNNRVME